MCGMSTLHRSGNWSIKVWGHEHPPVHVHVLHPDGRASIEIDGTVQNRGVPAKVIVQALAWVASHQADIRAEWGHLHNPLDRSTSS